MALFYPLVILLIGISFCIKDNQRDFIFYSLLIVLILVLSLRGSPDEYTRYMVNQANNFSQILDGFPFSESLFRLIAFFSLKTPFPRFTIYFVTYSFTFFAIFKGLELYKLGSLSKVLPICFFLSHQFLSLGYIAIRPALANAVAFWAISYLFTRGNFKNYLYLGSFAFLIHVQSVVVLLISFFVYYSKDFIIFKKRSYILTLIIILGLTVYFLRTNIENFLLVIVGNFDYLILNYVDYFNSESYGYDINILDAKILLAITLQVIIFTLYVIFLKKKNSAYSNCILMILIYPLIIISFSNIAFFAFRVASGLTLFNLPIIGGFSSQIKEAFYNKKLSLSLLIILSLSIILGFYNILITQRLSDFSFTNIDWILPKN